MSVFKVNNHIANLNHKIFSPLGNTLSAPKVQTNTPSYGYKTATLNGYVSFDGNATIVKRGFAYATTANPTTGNTNVEVAGTIGAFSTNLTNLIVGGTYYVRAYAKNSQGLTYGNEISFTLSLPKISWMLRSTGVAAYNLNSIGYGNGVFIATGDRGCANPGYVIKSTDYGNSWNTTSTNSYSSSACGYIGSIWYHTNRCYETTTNVWYSNNLTTGNTWTGKLISSGNYAYSSWKAGNYAVIGHYNSYYTYSTDGINWTNRKLEGVDSVTIVNASYSSRNSLYYITSNNGNKTYTMTNLDGTGQASIASLAGTLYYTVHGANESLAFVYNSSSATAIKKDTGDGKTFGTTVSTLPTYTNIAGITYYNGMYIMTYTNTGDYTKHVAVSIDGSTWIEASSIPSWNATVYGGNGNIATGLIGSTHYIMIIANNNMSVLIGTYAD